MSTSLPLPAPLFLNDHEARAVDALAGRIIPGDDDDPGAREAAAVVYIDRSLGGAYSHLQGLYQSGVRELDQLCEERHGAAFAELGEAEQDAVLEELDVIVETQPTDQGQGDGPKGSVAETRGSRLEYFFAVVREHVLQGYFCDPVYGGNRDGVGWKLVGFPGAYWGYEEYQGQVGFDSSQLPIKTLEDLRAERASIDSEPARGTRA